VLTRRTSRDAALVELQRLHAAILAAREKRGVRPVEAPLSPQTLAERELTRRLQAERDAAEPEREPAAAPRSSRLWWLAAAAAIVAAGAWLALTQTRRAEIVTGAAPAPAQAPTVRAAAPVTPDAASAAAPAATPRAVHVTLETIRPVWLRVRVDDARILEREVAAGEHLAFEGDSAIVVRTGDAGAVRVSRNGVDHGALGINGWPLTVSLSKDGLTPLTPTRPERPATDDAAPR
jgi:hypothetical protein